MYTSRAQERGGGLLFEAGNMQAGVAAKRQVFKEDHIDFFAVCFCRSVLWQQPN